MNNDISHALEYHNQTKHSYWSIRTRPHFLDWTNQPAPFKLYSDIEPVELPRPLTSSGVTAFDAMRESFRERPEVRLDINLISSLLFYSAGVTRTKTYPGGTIHFRAAACAGALYPIELYIVCSDLDGLPAGVYHFNPGDFALRKLRDGDYRAVLVRAAASEPAIAASPLTIICTALSWRSSWKYLDRAYRYHYWDCGMILANALAVSAALGLKAQVITGFVETKINRLVGIDGERELAVALLAVSGDDKGENRTGEQPKDVALADLSLRWEPLSASEVDHPSIGRMHDASSLASAEEVAEWRKQTTLKSSNSSKPSDESRQASLRVKAELPEPRDLPVETLEDVIIRRASTRHFARKALPVSELSLMLDTAVRPIPADSFEPGDRRLNEIYVIANQIDGLEAGAYVYNAQDCELEILKGGDFSHEAGRLALDQDLAADASATLFFMTDLEDVLQRFGNRGYRVAQLEAGIMSGRVYLSAYALRRGATGLTFYDDDVTEFFSPHAAGKSCMIVTAIGRPGKRPLF